MVAGRIAAGRDGPAGLDRLEERSAEAAAEVIPAGDPFPGGGAEGLRIGDIRRLLREPRVHLRLPDLGMELHAPRSLEPKRLETDAAPRQLDGARREIVRVVMPLEGVEVLGQRGRHWIGGSSLRRFDREPADLRLQRPEDARPGGPGEQLRAEADAEHRGAALEQTAKKFELRSQPAVPIFLVGMHGAAQDDDRVGGVSRNAVHGHLAFDELMAAVTDGIREDAGADARAVREREDSHPREPTEPRGADDFRPPYNPRMDERPIGVFDSGVGGLTVLHECLVTLPHEDFVYLGDGARLPYGPRPLDEVRRFASEIGSFLEAQGVKLVVVACNSATAAALPELQTELSVPVVGVIAPEAHAAVQATRNRRIGLLATQVTVSSGRYEELVRALDAGAEVVPVACPSLVPLIEGDDPFGEETVAAVREYAAPLKEAGVDTVILGCTHYPLIRPILQRVFGRDVTLVFSADETAREVAETLVRKRIENDPAREGAYSFLTTGDAAAFRAMGRRFLQLPIGEVEHVEIATLEAAA